MPGVGALLPIATQRPGRTVSLPRRGQSTGNATSYRTRTRSGSAVNGSMMAATPLRAIAAHRCRGASLPVPLSSLVGRASLIAQIRALLGEDGARLLTLIGPGGSGKTRLALAAAAELERAGAFPDGIVFVSLAALSNPEQVVSAVADALDIRVSDGLSPADALAETLRERRVLLVLDNFEHVAAAAPAVAALLVSCPRVAALV